MRYFAPVLFAASCSVALPAQGQAPKAQHFLFDGYTTAMSLDMKKMRDRGVWDELGAQPGLKLVFKMVEEQFGFSLDSLNQAMIVSKRKGAGESAHGIVEVSFVETDVAMKPGLDQEDMVRVEAGDYTMLASPWDENSVQVQVTPKLRVFGSTDLIQSVLEGQRMTGVPSGDVMSLTVGQKDLLGYAVLDFGDRAIQEDITDLLGEPDWAEDDKPTFLALRLSTQGDDDDPHLKLEVVVRHGKDGEGLVVSEKSVNERLKELMAVKEARLFMPLLKQIQHKRDRTDAIWSVDLGRARDFGGTVSMLAPFLMVTRASQQAQALMVPGVPAVPVPVAQAEEEGVAEAKPMKEAKPVKKGKGVVEIKRKPVVEPPPPPPPPTGNGGGGQL